jgi:hypothetical protein
MPRKGSKTKKKARSHDEGLWIICEDLGWIEVVQKAITSDKLLPPPKTVKGRQREDGRIEVLEDATYGLPREDLANLVKDELAKLDFTAEKVWKDDPIGETRLNNMIGAIIKIGFSFPLGIARKGRIQATEKYVIDRKLQKVEEWEEYIVDEDEETGARSYTPMPYLFQTHQIEEKALPLVYWDLWFADKLYELPGYSEADKRKITRLIDKLANYPFPVFEEGEPVIDTETGKQQIEYGEAMLYMSGFQLQSGSKRQYHAFIRSRSLKEKDGTEKVILEMKLSRAIKTFAHAFERPSDVAAEIAVPLIGIKGVEEMLKAVSI